VFCDLFCDDCLVVYSYEECQNTGRKCYACLSKCYLVNSCVRKCVKVSSPCVVIPSSLCTPARRVANFEKCVPLYRLIKRSLCT
jgi:hypothetical protein